MSSTRIPPPAPDERSSSGRRRASAGPPEIPGYRLVALLGEGGMGRVYRAIDALGRSVAVKVLLDAGRTPRSLARFEREAELLARARHSGIVAAHAWGRTERASYLVCELVEGRPLNESGHRLDLEARLDVVEQAARAVGAAHAVGVVHRDLKPTNLLLDEGGRLKVIDFGVSKGEGLEALTRTGQFVGTPLYAPPERCFAGADADAPTGDVWSLGAVAYELLTGRHPYPVDHPTQLPARAQGRAPRPRELPSAVADVLLQALDPEPRRRFPDGSALAEALSEARAGRSPRRWARRRALLLGLLGAGAAALALVWGVVQRGAPPRAARAEPKGAAPDAPSPDEEGAALLEAGGLEAALAAVGSRETPEALRVRAAALAGLDRWRELDELLARRPHLDPELQRLRGLAAVYTGDLDAAREDLPLGAPVLALSEEVARLADLRGRTAGAATADELLAAARAAVEHARACGEPGTPGAAEARRRAQAAVRDGLLWLGGALLVLTGDPADLERLAAAAADLVPGLERDGVQVAALWAGCARVVTQDEDAVAGWVRERASRLPPLGPRLDRQGPPIRALALALHFLARCAGGEAVPVALEVGVVASLDELGRHGPAGQRLRRLICRFLALVERRRACDAFRRGDPAAGAAHARRGLQQVRRSASAHRLWDDRVVEATLLLLLSDVPGARGVAREMDGARHRILLAECDLAQGRPAAAARRLRGLVARGDELAEAIALHARLLLGEVSAEEVLPLLPDEAPPHPLEPMGFEWRTGSGLREALEGGWWPGSARAAREDEAE